MNLRKDEYMKKDELKVEKVMLEIDDVIKKYDLTFFEINGIIEGVKQHYLFDKFLQMNEGYCKLDELKEL